MAILENMVSLESPVKGAFQEKMEQKVHLVEMESPVNQVEQDYLAK